MAAKRPSFQWYSADWMKDPGVRAMSLAARGLWIDMICLMDQSPRRGFLQHPNGQPVTADQLARMTGCSTDEASRMLQELQSAEVFSSTNLGVIYCRRMVRDENARQEFVEAGRRGGNPSLIPRVNPPDKPPDKGGIEEEEELEHQCSEIYKAYPRKIAKGAALRSIRRALRKVPYAVLLESVQAFAEARNGEDQQFTPYPASWFNAERWNDDRAQWRACHGNSGRNTQNVDPSKVRGDSSDYDT